ncbi:hypothetical protein HRG_004180 [Hirsutella rhossiliensis]|uniref:Uncharacterized protein n=1 Tax=Hirsutella rhossiliensis TaxID=111463 RepID=A0A9P8MYP3_9HYPO|nr:uncharacterized protein HRG_04180 [Hirsutella rhossiliensis]KAH0963752.1 hypothetical protein HRG_04180 [Hirsutella rhossiliensis]
MEQAFEQPDFDQVAHHFRDAADHFERCGNLPAVDGGVRLMQRMDAMMERFAALEQTVRRGFTDMAQRMDGFDRKVTVTNRNAVVRAQNSTVVRGNMDLEPLYSVLTGDRLDNFPQTLDQLERLPLPAVNDLLTHLGEEPRGRLEERRRHLKLAVGVTTRAV